MIQLTYKDRVLIQVLWPWGLWYVFVILVSIAASWAVGGLNDWPAFVGSIFFVLLLAPFSWYGLAEYFDWLVIRGIESTRASLLAIVYLSSLAIKFVFVYGVSSRWNLLIGFILGLAVVFVWVKYRRTRSKSLDSSSVDVPHHLRWLADLTMFLIVVILVVAL